MPTPCQKCGEIFDLHNGSTSEKWFPNTVICSTCGNLEEEEIEKDQEMQEHVDCLENAIWDIKNSGKELNKLNGLHLLSEENRNIVLRIINDIPES